MPPASLPAEAAINPGPKITSSRNNPFGARRNPRRRTLRPLIFIRTLARLTACGCAGNARASRAASGSNPSGVGPGEGGLLERMAMERGNQEKTRTVSAAQLAGATVEVAASMVTMPSNRPSCPMTGRATRWLLSTRYAASRTGSSAWSVTR